MSDGPANIVLVGFMGSGKTTVGQVLARDRGMAFVDTDELVVCEAGGVSIPALFVREGEAAFRARECRAIATACAGRGQVIATGGGAVLDAGNVARLRDAGPIVWLTTRPDIIVARTRDGADARPLLTPSADSKSDADPLYAHVLKMLGERGPLYQRIADLIVDTSDRTPDSIAREIGRKIEAGAWRKAPAL